MKNLIVYRRMFAFAWLLFITGLCSCNQSNDITVLNSGSESYASIEIDNPYGDNIVIAAQDTLGAIGFILDEKVHWLKGEPEVSNQTDSLFSYIWKYKETSVTMSVESRKDELEFTLKLDDPEMKPSAWLINTKAGEEEYFTGVFERVVDGLQDKSWEKGITAGLNLRGERVDVKLKPTVSAYAPFYISSANYALFVHGTWPGVIDFCREQKDLVQILFEGPQFSFSLMVDKEPVDLVKRHAIKTGPSYVPPKWAFGPWRWRDEHVNTAEYYDGSKVNAPYNAEVVEDILLMEAYDIPCTAYWIDRPWGPGVRGFDDYKIDYDRLPKFENMIKWLGSKQIETMLWIGPFVMGDMADVAEERGYYLESKTWKDSRQILMDFTNEEACKWWGENGPAKLAKMGVKGFKLDRADGEKLMDSLSLFTSTGTSYRENYNDYPHQYVKATYDAVKTVLGNDFVLFPRAQYTGSAKYGALWAGDTGNPSEGLRSAVIGMLRCAIMGYPIWGSDTGGYPQDIDSEVTQRWLGFSCFSPIMEVGPTNNRGFWGMNYEPSFDRELLAAWRFYTKLRMSLVDYIYENAETAHETGMPVARPLFIDYPDQKESWNDWATYKFGDDLLVSVIWEKGKSKHSLYLPAGETWINLWDNKEYEGGRYIEVDAAVHQTPVFMRKGAELNLPELNELYEESVKLTSVKYDMHELESKEDWKSE